MVVKKLKSKLEPPTRAASHKPLFMASNAQFSA